MATLENGGAMFPGAKLLLEEAFIGMAGQSVARRVSEA